MVTSVSSLSQALSALRLQLLDARAARSAGHGHTREPARATASASTQTALQSLPAKLRVARARDGRLIAAKALRLFVEAAMLDELGAAMQLDPQFGAWVERTCLTIEQDPDNEALIVEAIRELDYLAD